MLLSEDWASIAANLVPRFRQVMDEFDLIVIGAGPGGYVAAIRAAQLGLKVACVEKEAALGGTCLRVGCIPSKALLESSALYANARKSATKHGIEFEGIRLNLATMLKRKEQVVSMLTKGVESLFRKNQITSIYGQATLVSAGEVRVESATGPQSFRAKAVLVATGSHPTQLPGFPVDGQTVVTSREALSLSAVPEHLVVIGGGYIGIELGCVWNRLGAQVTIVEACDRILPQMDEELGREARKILSKQGLKLMLGRQVSELQQTGASCNVRLDSGDLLPADKVLVATGRRPNSDHLGLDALGIERDSRGAIRVDDRFQSNVAGVYAIGDVIGGAMLAHKAEEEAVAFAECLAGNRGRVNDHAIPGVVYTDPEIASVGKTEQALLESETPFTKATFPFRANGRARASHQTEGFSKFLVDQPSGSILGAHLIGAHAGELINEIALAMNSGLGVEQLSRSCHAHPTFGEVLKETALAALERPLHS